LSLTPKLGKRGRFAKVSIHEAQILNYLKATGFKIELLINFKHPKAEIRNGDEITSPSRRIDLGQICSISNHKS